MRLLICTQRVNRDDPILGFFHNWLVEFSKQCESIEVVCLEEGGHELPENVRVHSLGKEGGVSRVKYLSRLYRYAWQLRHEYDAVFVHMNPQYVVVGPLWRLLGKRVALWYSHRATSLWLRLGVVLADRVFSTTPHAMRLKSKKVAFVGHGIDTEQFPFVPERPEKKRILYVGRLSPIKRVDLIIQAFNLLIEEGIDATLTLIGDEDEHRVGYQDELKAMESEQARSRVEWLGSVANAELPRHHREAQVIVNASPAGGMDKTVLEGMLSGLVPVVTNDAYRDVLGEYAPQLIAADDPLAFKESLERALTLTQAASVRSQFRAQAEEHASLSRLITKIITTLKSC